MHQKNNFQELEKQGFDATFFSPEVLRIIERKNLWNLWVPKKYGGLEMSFSEGLQILKELAFIDGSLGWTITLCSGANYFIGNLTPEAAKEIFINSEKPVLGGSGGILGTAEKKEALYVISGNWRYATGAPYLTHFTLNAKILEEGKEVLNDDGSQKILSFVLPKKDVQIVQDWNSMGLKATATHSFEVKEVTVSEKYSFIYDQFYLPQPIFKINFSLFADLTLWTNYIGMAEHFYEEAFKELQAQKIKDLKNVIFEANNQLFLYAREIEEITLRTSSFSEEFIQKVHEAATKSVKQLSQNIIEVYPLLGIKGSRKNSSLNSVFRDYFTATQHHIFHKI
ncbi:acyl-CoA dehydrogenase family protein [Salinimicrobium sp. GXAS 041]|uniref:acyl-CoA dehydrogenase family protein n=1 Tax=Salinimicrobium sp. GXAS 041 TaxID=3400806 RepID=UPI003C7272E2